MAAHNFNSKSMFERLYKVVSNTELKQTEALNPFHDLDDSDLGLKYVGNAENSGIRYADEYYGNYTEHHLIDKSYVDREFLNDLMAQLAETKTETPKKPKIGIIFLRLNELWKNLLGSGSVQVDYMNDGGNERYTLSDEKSTYPLCVIYDYQRRIVLNYNGLTDQIGKEEVADFIPSIEMTHRIFQEIKIDALETELGRRAKK